MRTHTTRYGKAVTETAGRSSSGVFRYNQLRNFECGLQAQLGKRFSTFCWLQGEWEQESGHGGFRESALLDLMKTTAVSVVKQKAMARSGGLQSFLLCKRRSEDFTISLNDLEYVEDHSGPGLLGLQEGPKAET